MIELVHEELSILGSEGGWVFWCLLGLAFGIAYSLLSIWNLLRLPRAPILKSSQWKCLLLQGSRSSEILELLSQRIGEKKLEGQVNQIEEEMFSTAERRIPFAFVLITTAPLVGLLGTVSGMFTTFDGMSAPSSTGPASVISKGVSEALITTQTGLVISVPAYFIHNALKVRYERLRHGFQQIGTALQDKF
ncbi:MAG: MotA/TolQ/ExbB proton channel family protein [Verrucomicrobiales bacterium]|nr:MotA/TolQ/ExbB proton channel family protein [Verrucomicrobiales bacterium]|tara:strand:- start:21 stop:593 length:573 start_codon:yes stop_codon:yes gene_type:complete